ncbi:protein LURP-one-related 5-like [Lycium barbarum]|uniref:protein LURP-one-related 5-like n=1 Tax=Lycium barbarum TaxID=112863 RepID=UPI00293E0767|nr:protein LURP-one-related 5-like [Lycium barbarum]
MSKIHPAYHHRKLRSKTLVYNNEDERKDNNNNRLPPPPPARLILSRPRANCPSIFTVWKKSSMSFQGTDGFTVFDKQGRLVFRVDNYTRRKNRSIASRGSRSGGLILMDAHGKPLLTLRPQMSVQLQYEWNGYRGEEDDDQSTELNNSTPLFVMRRPPLSLFTMMGTSTTSSCKAQVFVARENNVMDMKSRRRPNYRVEGSFRRRNCNIIDSDGHMVANISRKVANTTTRARSTILISDDVFSLVVQPGFEPHIFMAFIIILDRMYPNSYAPIICS